MKQTTFLYYIRYALYRLNKLEEQAAAGELPYKRTRRGWYFVLEKVCSSSTSLLVIHIETVDLSLIVDFKCNM